MKFPFLAVAVLPFVAAAASVKEEQPSSNLRRAAPFLKAKDRLLQKIEHERRMKEGVDGEVDHPKDRVLVDFEEFKDFLEEEDKTTAEAAEGRQTQEEPPETPENYGNYGGYGCVAAACCTYLSGRRKCSSRIEVSQIVIMSLFQPLAETMETMEIMVDTGAFKLLACVVLLLLLEVPMDGGEHNVPNSEYNSNRNVQITHFFIVLLSSQKLRKLWRLRKLWVSFECKQKVLERWWMESSSSCNGTHTSLPSSTAEITEITAVTETTEVTGKWR